MRKNSTTTLDCNQRNGPFIDSFIERAALVLREKNLRFTKQRRDILICLAESKKPMKPYAIHEKIEADGGTADVVTVYRSLEALEQAGLCHHVRTVNGYIACTLALHDPSEAVYFICSRCDCVVEQPCPSEQSNMLKSLSKDEGFNHELVRIEVIGVCSHCQPVAA
ncbi:MAG: Fur family transcriptional regulator [Fimbriimonadaceae bacterium]